MISSIYSGDSNWEISNLLSVLQGAIHPLEIRLVLNEMFCNKLLDSVLDWTFSNLQNCIRFWVSLESLSNRRALGPNWKSWGSGNLASQISLSKRRMRKGLFLVIQEISQLWFEVFSAVGKYPFQYVSPSAIGCRF